MGIKKFIATQLSHPSGWFGKNITAVLLNKGNGTLENMGLRLMDIQSADVVLEIGFGNGRLISLIGNKIETGKIMGIEISKDMINLAKRKNNTLIEKKKLVIDEASVEKIPAQSEYFDKIFTANTIYFWPEVDKNIQEVKRVLKPGGKFYCAIRPEKEMLAQGPINKNRDIFKHLFSEESIKEFLISSGFAEVEVYLEKGKPFTNLIAVAKK